MVTLKPRKSARTRRPARDAAAPAPASGASDSTRSRLLAEGLRVARSGGLRAITVRGVAAATGTNLGSFVHHFGTREAFIAEVIEHWYAPFMARLQAIAQTAGDASLPRSANRPGRNGAAERGQALVRLRALLRQVARFVVEHGGFVGQLMQDALAGEPAARQFVGSLAGRHPVLILQAITEAQRRRALPANEPPLHLLLFLMGAIGAPVLAAGPIVRSGLLPASIATQLLPLATDLDAAQRRVDWALQALSQWRQAPAWPEETR